MTPARLRESLPPHASPGEALGMMLLCFGSAICGALAAMSGPVRLIAFSDDMGAAMAVFYLFLGGTALAVLHVRGYPLQSLMPRPSWHGAAAGIALYLCAALAGLLVYRLVPQAELSLGDMVPPQVSWYVVVPMALVTGGYEEIFLLAYLMRGLRRLGASTAIGITVLLRVLIHMNQGPVCALSAALFGLMLAVYYHYRGRLFPVVLAHVVAGVVPFYYQIA